MRVKLKRRRGLDMRSICGIVTECAPFVDNSRANLIHRPRSLQIFDSLIRLTGKTHLSVDYWCGNSANGRTKFTFLEYPPHDKIVCERCEAKAIEAGEPSTDSLVGYHVHKGRVYPKRTCCLHKEKGNEVY